jgi:cytosine/creatinine deaminase
MSNFVKHGLNERFQKISGIGCGRARMHLQLRGREVQLGRVASTVLLQGNPGKGIRGSGFEQLAEFGKEEFPDFTARFKSIHHESANHKTSSLIRLKQRLCQSAKRDARLPDMLTDTERQFLEAAIEEARKGLSEGGIPIGSVLVIENRIVGRGHNRRVQKGSAILHAEMDALENAGRLKASDYARATLYSTLSPCDMCSGTSLLYKIPSIVIGENKTFQGPEEYLRSRGVKLTLVQDPTCIELMRQFISAKPSLWNEDIGV